MARLKIRYLTKRPRADGTARYHWQPNKALQKAGWKITRLSDNETEAIAEAQEINARVDQWRIDQTQSTSTLKKGTMSYLIDDYQNHRHFTDLREKTRREYMRYLKIIDEWAGDMPAASINARMVQDLYDTLRDKKPRKAAFLIQVLRLVFSHGERRSIIAKNTNPATNPKLTYKARKGEIWTPEETRAFVEAADAMDLFEIGTAVMLNEWAGQRRGDILAFTMDAYKDGIFFITQSKTGAEVAIEVDAIPELKSRIEEQLHRNRSKKICGRHLIQQENSQPYNGDWFARRFRRVRDEAAKKNPGMERLQFLHLRHTAVTRLAEAGCEIPEIASITGHTFKSCQEIIDRYNVRTTKMARGAILKRIRAQGD